MSDAPLRVAVADDDALARRMLGSLIESDPGFELVGTAEDADAASELVRCERPDVILLDWVMPAGGGPAAARAIAEHSPETRMVALTASDSEEASLDMLRAGAKSFLVKGTPGEEILNALRGAMRL